MMSIKRIMALARARSGSHSTDHGVSMCTQRITLHVVTVCKQLLSKTYTAGIIRSMLISVDMKVMCTDLL